jgi:hypothetical protein
MSISPFKNLMSANYCNTSNSTTPKRTKDERLWPLFNYTVMNGTGGSGGRHDSSGSGSGGGGDDDAYTNARAPIHIITGAAGSEEGHESFGPPFLAGGSAVRNSKFGYGHFDVHNATHARWRQLDADGVAVLDEIWIVKSASNDSDSSDSVKRAIAYACIAFVSLVAAFVIARVVAQRGLHSGHGGSDFVTAGSYAEFDDEDDARGGGGGDLRGNPTGYGSDSGSADGFIPAANANSNDIDAPAFVDDDDGKSRGD